MIAFLFKLARVGDNGKGLNIRRELAFERVNVGSSYGVLSHCMFLVHSKYFSSFRCLAISLYLQFYFLHCSLQIPPAAVDFDVWGLWSSSGHRTDLSQLYLV